MSSRIYNRMFSSSSVMKHFSDIVKKEWKITQPMEQKVVKLLSWHAVIPYLKCYREFNYFLSYKHDAFTLIIYKYQC